MAFRSSKRIQWSILLGVFISGILVGIFAFSETASQTPPPETSGDYVQKGTVRRAPYLDGGDFTEYKNSRYHLDLVSRTEVDFGPIQAGVEGSEEYIPRLEEKQAMLADFSKFAAHYLPNQQIHWIDEVDVTADGAPEYIVYHSCFGCNATPRNVDIISGSQLIFSAQGGQLSVSPMEAEAGFQLSTAMVPRQGYTIIDFKLNHENEFVSVREEDFYYED